MFSFHHYFVEVISTIGLTEDEFWELARSVKSYNDLPSNIKEKVITFEAWSKKKLEEKLVRMNSMDKKAILEK